MNDSHNQAFPTTAYTPDPAGSRVENPSDQTMISTTQPSQATLPDGTFVPGYELVRELGRGGMGVVYLAKQQGLNRLVALKMVLAGKHASESDLARFKTEAGAVAQLQHPHIVQVFETGEYQGNPWFSMEFVAGGSLDKRLQGRPLTPREAARVISLLAEAIAHAHSRGVLHRDLKPGNILVHEAEAHSTSIDSTQRNLRGPSKGNTVNLDLGSKPGTDSNPGRPVTLKITDFGLAKQLELGVQSGAKTQDGAVIGSPSYMAPEQAAGDQSQLGPATDLYALGAILYELLTGRPPFRASTAWDTILQVLHDEPVPPTRLQPRLPKDLETICLKCLAKDPKKRYATVLELEADLQRFVNDEPIHARPTPWWERAWKAAKRRPAITTLVFTAILAITAIIFLVLDNNRKLERERDVAKNAQFKAETEQKKAQARLTKSAEAIERILVSAASENWSRSPEMQEERRKFLQEVVAFYQSFLDEESDDPQLRRQAAQAYYNMGGVFLLMGELDQAEDKFHKARAMQESLCAQFPDNPDYKFDLVKTMNFLGNAEVMQGKFGPSENTYEKAVRQAETIVKAFPGRAEFQTSLIQAYVSLAQFNSNRNPSVARDYFHKALEVAKEINLQDDEPYSHKLAFAHSMVRLGEFLLNNDQAASAGPYLEEAKPLLDALAGMPAPSASERDRYEMIATTFAIVKGNFLVRTGQQEAGEAELRRGLKLTEGLLAQRPRAFPYRQLQVSALQSLANSLEKRKSKEAKVVIERSSRLQEQMTKDMPHATWIKVSSLFQRSMHLVMRTRDGDLDGIEEGFKEILTSPGIFMGTQQAPKYNIACAYAQGSKHLKDPAEKERWASRAVKMLEELYQSRYFIRDREIDHLAVDADLDPLRDRTDFKAFLKHFENRPRQTASPGKAPAPTVKVPLLPRKAPTKITPPGKAG